MIKKQIPHQAPLAEECSIAADGISHHQETWQSNSLPPSDGWWGNVVYFSGVMTTQDLFPASTRDLRKAAIRSGVRLLTASL